jgi:hypothetical protein
MGLYHSGKRENEAEIKTVNGAEHLMNHLAVSRSAIVVIIQEQEAS